MSTNRSLEPSRPLEPEDGPRRMTNAEAVALCRYARAACPQQKFDEYTPDAWADLLADLRFADCQDALKSIVKRQPFVSPSEIRAEVIRVRNKRIGDFGITPNPPEELAPVEAARWQRDLIRRIADGEMVAETPAIASAPMPPELAADMGKFGRTLPRRNTTTPEVAAQAIRRAREALRPKTEETDA